MFSHVFHSFSKSCIIHELKKIFKNNFLVVFLDMYLYQYMILAKHFY